MALSPEHIDRSDNLRIIHYDHRKQARAFMQLIERMEKGTAMVRMPDGNGFAMGGDIHVGAMMVYRALAGDGPYEAVVTAVRGVGLRRMKPGFDWLVDLDVMIPGCNDPHHLTKIVAKRYRP